MAASSNSNSNSNSDSSNNSISHSNNNSSNSTNSNSSNSSNIHISTQSFLFHLSKDDQEELSSQLHSFVIRHAAHHRPIVLITSGGTAADLEVNAVRSLENFSTGLRGAISVEKFLAKGYAVIHLWRTGSASPYGRILSQELNIVQANHGVTNEAFGTLLASADSNDGILDNRRPVSINPWLIDSTYTTSEAKSNLLKKGISDGLLALNQNLSCHSRLQLAWQERKLSKGRLLTISFRTVEDYLAKLELCASSLKDSQSLALCYLAAAVSDFYVASKSLHKIQSDGGTLTVELNPVPKCLGLLTKSWCPEAMTVSFKLETDHTILRKKAEKAVYKYGVTMVIGNLLQSRHDKVWILHAAQPGTSVQDWDMREVTKASGSGDVDALEEAIVDFCVQQHLAFISKNYLGDMCHHLDPSRQELYEKDCLLQRELFWNRVRQGAYRAGGTVLAITLSFTMFQTWKRRMS